MAGAKLSECARLSEAVCVQRRNLDPVRRDEVKDGVHAQLRAASRLVARELLLCIFPPPSNAAAMCLRSVGAVIRLLPCKGPGEAAINVATNKTKALVNVHVVAVSCRCSRSVQAFTFYAQQAIYLAYLLF